MLRIKLHHIFHHVTQHFTSHLQFICCVAVAIVPIVAIVAMGQSHGGVGVRKRRISLTSRQSLTSNESEWTEHSHKDGEVGKSLRLH